MSTISAILPVPPDNFSTTLSSGISSSATTIPLNSVSGLGTEGIGVVYAKNSSGDIVASSIEFIHWTSVSGNNVLLTDTGDRGITGSASGAQSHNSNDTFEVWIHSKYYSGMRTALLNAFDATTGAVDTTLLVTRTGTQTLTNKTLTAPTITSPTITGTIAGSPTITKPTHNGSVQALTADADAATITFDLAASNIHTTTLGGNRTLAVTNAAVGQVFFLRLLQDGTGSRIPTWFSTIKWAGGAAPTLTTTASKADLIGFVCTSSGNYDGFVVGQNL